MALCAFSLRAPATNSKIEEVYNEHIIDKVNDFEYLGTQIISVEKEIAARLVKARTVFTSMSKLWRLKDIPLNLKINIFKTTCMSVLLYGCESWIMNQKMEMKLNSFATNCYRYICGYRKIYKIRNLEILQKVSMVPITSIIHDRQKKFINNVLTSELCENEFIKKYIKYCPDFGKNKRGRPKQSIEKYIKHISKNDPDNVNNPQG